MRLFILFHINLCFSSIEEEERKSVLKLSYWPLLNLIENLKLPIGIEATAYTLEEINKIDPKFINKTPFICMLNLFQYLLIITLFDLLLHTMQLINCESHS